MSDLQKKATRLLRSALGVLDRRRKKLTDADVDIICGELEEVAIKAIRVSAYLRHRVGGFTSHHKAVDKQNAVAREARKALGFTMTTDIHF